jgi:hypothetical protein
VDGLSAEARVVIVGVVGRSAPELLSRLESGAGEPSRQDRIDVEEALAAELVRHFDPDWERDDTARAIERTLGEFLGRWPIEPDE